jgi:hypothetical protein
MVKKVYDGLDPHFWYEKKYVYRILVENLVESGSL